MLHLFLLTTLGLDAMIEELGLDDGDWELFSVNDNASNMKLGIKLSMYLKQYLCDIHTLELAVKDTFKNVPGMKRVTKKCKAIGKFTHQSTVANSVLKKEAKKEKIKFKKVVNPPNTRWSGHHDNLASVLHLKKPIMNLTANNDAWAEHELSVSDWKLVEGAVKLLKPVRDTVKAWEGEKEPTMHRVVERIYSMHTIIDDFTNDVNNTRYGIGFARELKQQIEKRFPNTGTHNKLRRFANYLAPEYKGIHLEAVDKLVDTKDEISAELFDPNNVIREVETADPDVDVTLSPTSQLRKKIMDRSQRTQTEGLLDSRISPIEKEFRRYEAFSLPPKNVSILEWWKCHANVLPLLSKLAKKVLTVPASSAKSERVFSYAGNFVTAKRNSLGAKKVEDLIVIKENKLQVQEFKANSSYKLRRVQINTFEKVSIDVRLNRLVNEEDDDDMFDVDGSVDDAEAEIIYVNGESDVDSDYSDDDENSDIEEL